VRINLAGLENIWLRPPMHQNTIGLSSSGQWHGRRFLQASASSPRQGHTSHSCELLTRHLFPIVTLAFFDRPSSLHTGQWRSGVKASRSCSTTLDCRKCTFLVHHSVRSHLDQFTLQYLIYFLKFRWISCPKICRVHCNLSQSCIPDSVQHLHWHVYL